jgi:hypothetical protein
MEAEDSDSGSVEVRLCLLPGVYLKKMFRVEIPNECIFECMADI